MDEALSYIVTTVKKLDNGELPNHPDPADPGDLGTPLTQDEIDWLKRFIKELRYRFEPL